MMRLEDRCRLFLEACVADEPRTTFLRYGTPFELLVAVVLSAQCTDSRVNSITPSLFTAFPTAYELARATPDEVFGYIRSVSYPRSKARYLVRLADGLVRFFGGSVPDSADDLQRLAGVGRKSAHVVLSALYGRGVIAVDTHVFRVARRLGLVGVQASTPLAVERGLERHVPMKYRSRVAGWLIAHGRQVCRARRPRCGVCPFATWCRYYRRQKSGG